MPQRLCLVVGLLLLARATPAQDVPADAKAAKPAAVARGITTSDTSSVTQVGSVFSIEGSTVNKTAAGQIGIQLRDFTLTLGAEAPLDDSTQSGTLADLNGLKNKTVGKSAVMWQHWFVQSEAYSAALQAFCRTSAGGVSDEDCTFLHFKRLANAPNATVVDKQRFNELRNLGAGTVLFAGGNDQIAPEEFNYLNKADLSQAKEHHTSWSAGGYAGVLLEDGVMLSVGYERQIVYRASDQTQICAPIGTLTALQCSQRVIGPPGGPMRSNQTVFESRKVFNQYFAISPKVTRDWSARMTGADIPLYFFKDKDGGLNGGVTLGYIFEKKSFTATAFIGQVLGLITQ